MPFVSIPLLCLLRHAAPYTLAGALPMHAYFILPNCPLFLAILTSGGISTANSRGQSLCTLAGDSLPLSLAYTPTLTSTKTCLSLRSRIFGHAGGGYQESYLESTLSAIDPMTDVD